MQVDRDYSSGLLDAICQDYQRNEVKDQVIWNLDWTWFHCESRKKGQSFPEISRKWMSAGLPDISCAEWSLSSWDDSQHSSFLGMGLLLLTSKGRMYFPSTWIQSGLVMALTHRMLALETLTLGNQSPYCEKTSCVERPWGGESKCSNRCPRWAESW